MYEIMNIVSALSKVKNSSYDFRFGPRPVRTEATDGSVNQKGSRLLPKVFFYSVGENCDCTQ